MSSNQKPIIFSGLALLSGLFPILAQVSETPTEGIEEIPTVLTQTWGSYEWILPTFTDISVHDPSLVVADGTFYVFGSHLSVAKTRDFMNWERVADLVTATNPTFNNVLVELSETFKWAQTDTLWAPDVIQLADGKFYFYYNACKGDSPRSALGVAVSNTVEGPYVDKGIILKSGMWGEISEDGETVYDATIQPNVVDPDTFYDKEGNLWMIYGSYSGGIFILKMDPLTGLPYEGQGYGEHLMGGNHQCIEGPNVLYSPHTDYYYMFVSYGGLAYSGGYNLRVARSKTPDGPYFDSEGNDMRNVTATTAFNNAAIAPYAAKLIGNYLYSPTQNTLGYVSPGHNTTYFCEETGQYFIIFHTRFPYKGEFHQVRVHEMFFNEDGWPVVAPLRFAPRIDYSTFLAEAAAEDADVEGDTPDETGTEVDPIVDPVDDEETDGSIIDPETEPEVAETPLVYSSDPVTIEEIPGEYQLINHGKDTTYSIKRSQSIYLYADGTLKTGSLKGTWSFYDMEVVPVVDTDELVEDETGITGTTVTDPSEDANPGATAEPEVVVNPVLKNLITLEIESFGTYKGVVSIQWNQYLQKFVLTFTAMSDSGQCIWGARWADLATTKTTP